MSLPGQVYIIFRKEMLVWIKNPIVPVVRSLVFPLLWIVIFGTAFSGTVNHIPVALVQEDFGDPANEFINKLNERQIIDITTTTNFARAYDLLLSGEVYGLIFIPPDFSEKISQGLSPNVQLSVDETTPQVSELLISYISSVSMEYSDEIILNSGEGRVLNRRLIMERNTVFGKGIEYLDFLAPGVIMMTILFSALFSGGLGLIMDRQLGTLKMLMVAPISKEAIILGKTFSGVIQSMTSGVVALGVSLLMGVQIKTGAEGFVILLFLMFLSAFGFIGMSLIFGSKITLLEQFMVVMMVIVMPMWFLSGSMYPIESMPGWMKPVAAINPMTYGTDAFRQVMNRGMHYESLLFDIVYLTGFSMLMFFIGSKTFRRTI